MLEIISNSSVTIFINLLFQLLYYEYDILLPKKVEKNKRKIFLFFSFN